MKRKKVARTTTTTYYGEDPAVGAGIGYDDSDDAAVRSNRRTRVERDEATMKSTAPVRSRSTTTTEESTTTVEPDSGAREGVTTGEAEVTADRRARPGGLFIEPYVSVGQDSSSIEGISAVDNEGTMRSLTGGARFGIHAWESLFGGLDGRYSRTNFDDTFVGDVDGNMVNVGPMAGVQFPDFGLRAWGTYVLLGLYDPDSGAQGVDVEFSDPRGFRLGAGYRFEAVGLNVEYENISWKSSNIESAGAVGSLPEIDLDNEGFNVSLSFPIEL